MRIAFLGLGKMGSAIARRFVDKGYDVTVWNRTASTAEAFAQEGGTAAASPSEAVREAQVTFTMVNDDAALEAVLFAGGALDALPAGAIHVSMSTISVALAERLEREHAQRGQRYLAAPVFGRPGVAAEGKLWLAVAGEDTLVTEMTPVLDVISRGMSVVGTQPKQAHALKLGGNFLITAMIASLSEALTFAEGTGVDPELFLETVNSALFQSPFYANYGKVMLHPPEQAAATVALGAKDTRLFQEAAQVPTPLAALFAKQFQTAIDDGKSGADWAAGYLEVVRREAKGAAHDIA